MHADRERRARERNAQPCLDHADADIDAHDAENETELDPLEEGTRHDRRAQENPRERIVQLRMRERCILRWVRGWESVTKTYKKDA